MNLQSGGTSNEQLHYSAVAALRMCLRDKFESADAIVLAAAGTKKATEEEPEWMQAWKDDSPASTPSPSRMGSFTASQTGKSGSPTAASARVLPSAVALQRELNQARLALPTSAAGYVARVHKIKTLLHQFTSLASAVVQRTVLHAVACGLFSDKDYEEVLGWQAVGVQSADMAHHQHHRPPSPPQAKGKRQTNQALHSPNASPDPSSGAVALDAFKVDLLHKIQNGFSEDGVTFVCPFTYHNLVGHYDQIREELREASVRQANRRAADGEVVAPSNIMDPLTPAGKQLLRVLAFERIRKAVHREVKTRRDLMNYGHMENYCQVPLCAAIDYMGITFFAEVDLQFSPTSAQGGGLFQNTHQWFGPRVLQGELMGQSSSRVADHVHRALSIRCFLKLHPKGGVTNYGPADLQVHVPPTDGAIYVRSCRRMCPPVLRLPCSERPPSSASASSSLCQTAGLRLLPSFFELFCEPQQSFSPDAWVLEPSRTIDAVDMECLNANQVLHDRAIPFVADVMVLLDLFMSTHPPSSTEIAPAAAAPTVSGKKSDTIGRGGGPSNPTSSSSAPDAMKMATQWWMERMRHHASDPMSAVKAVKGVMHACGVNLCFLGKVLHAAQQQLYTIDSLILQNLTIRSETMSAEDIIRLHGTMRPQAAPHAATEDPFFIARHPMVTAMRTELGSRCLRAVAHDELRSKVVELSRQCRVKAELSLMRTGSSKKLDRRRSQQLMHMLESPVGTPPHPSRIGTAENSRGELMTALQRVMLSIERQLCDCVCDVFARASGELLSSHNDDDKTFWNGRLLPLMQVHFGFNCGFARSLASTSNVTIGGKRGSEQTGVLGISTASRVRTRALRHDETEGSGFLPEVQPRPKKLAGLPFSPWGTVTDPNFQSEVPREAYCLHQAEKRTHEGSLSEAIGSATNSGAPDAMWLLEPDLVALQMKKRMEQQDDVRLGACQDYNLVRRSCEMTGSFVEIRGDSPSGISCVCWPHAVVPGYSGPLSVQLVSLLLRLGGSTPLPKSVEQQFLDDVKERKTRGVNNAPESTQLRAYHRLASLYSLIGRYPSAVEWFRKMRDVLVRDVGSNDVAQAMALLNEARVELLRRRYTEACDAASHVVSMLQLSARDTQLLTVAMSTLLDALDATGANLSAHLRAKKLELSRDLVPRCRRFGLPIGRVAAREAIGRLAQLPPPQDTESAASVPRHRRTPPRSPNRTRSPPRSPKKSPDDQASASPPPGAVLQPDVETVVHLGASCVLVLREQGLDAEAASFLIPFLVHMQRHHMPILLPLVTALICHCIPLTSTFFRPAVEMLVQRLREVFFVG